MICNKCPYDKGCKGFNCELQFGSAAPESSAKLAQQELLATTSMGMEPIAQMLIDEMGGVAFEYGNHQPISRGWESLYSADQIATLQAKLEQAEKYRAELVMVIKDFASSYDEGMDWAKEAIAKYEVKKS